MPAGSRLPWRPSRKEQRTKRAIREGVEPEAPRLFRCQDEGGDVQVGHAACRGVRGAIEIDGTDPDTVLSAVAELLDGLVGSNQLDPADVAALVFTLPDELLGTNPAAAARDHGWAAVPVLMVREHGGDTRVPFCLRALLLWNT